MLFSTKSNQTDRNAWLQTGLYVKNKTWLTLAFIHKPECTCILYLWVDGNMRRNDLYNR